MNESSVERIVLDLAVEDSYALSEIVSRVRQARPGLSAKQTKELARKTVEEMLDAGLITATRLESPEGPESSLDREAAKEALADDLTWLELPHWRPHVRIVATSAGTEAYRKG
jgi:hypothetical protein